MTDIRKLVLYRETVFVEGERAVAKPHILVAAAAVMRNPWAGQGYVENLKPQVKQIAPGIGELLVPELLAAIGGADNIEAYGKAAVVGLNGEIEHASAMIHTLYFGNKLREAVAGTAYLSFTNKRAPASCSIDIPLKHKSKEGARSHFLTVSFVVPDAPGPDEIVVALGIASSGRPHQRIGDRYEDLAALGTRHTA